MKYFIVSMLLSVISLTAYSSNFVFFNNSAMSFFSKEDLKLSKSAQNEALEKYKDGMKLIWKNPQTGSHGTFVPMHTVYENGSVCRHMKIMQTANLVHDKAVYRFCKLNDVWRIV